MDTPHGWLKMKIKKKFRFRQESRNGLHGRPMRPADVVGGVGSPVPRPNEEIHLQPGLGRPARGPGAQLPLPQQVRPLSRSHRCGMPPPALDSNNNERRRLIIIVKLFHSITLLQFFS